MPDAFPQVRCPSSVRGMLNNTIKTHLVLHIHDDVLNFGVPKVMNSSYSESGHITICKDTTRNTQKRSQTFTLQAATRYVENLAISRGFSAIGNSTGSTKFPLESIPTSSKLARKLFVISKDANDNPCCHLDSAPVRKHVILLRMAFLWMLMYSRLLLLTAFHMLIPKLCTVTLSIIQVRRSVVPCAPKLSWEWETMV